MDEHDRVALVTGASQGIGEAVARLFAEKGMRVVLTDLTDAVQAVADEIDDRYPDAGAFAVVTDVTDADACDALVAAMKSRHGRVDVLAHATAIPQRQASVVDLAPDEWDQIMAVNAKGAFLLCRSVIPAMTRPGGAIVFTGSFTGEVGQPQRAAYCASKGALRLFTQSLALELAAVGIRVNGVAPAFVESAMGRQGLERAAARNNISVEQAQAERDAGIPLGREATAGEVAEAFLYLASPASSYVTGAWLDVNGGLLLR